jgi:hypothetical protein
MPQSVTLFLQQVTKFWQYAIQQADIHIKTRNIDLTDCGAPKEGSRRVKGKLLLSVVIVFLSLPTAIQAGIFENTDPDPYKYEATVDGVPSYGTIYGNSALYGFCNHGCVIKIIDSGQTIEMQPDDHVIIDNGELKRQDD